MQPLPSEDKLAIIQLCQEHGATHRRGSGITSCVLGGTPYLIKYGSFKTLSNRVKTQLFLQRAESTCTVNKPRISQLLHYFDDESREKTYLVTEFITLATILDPDDLGAKIKEALTWLSGVLPPFDDKLGPLGGGYIQHGFFKEFEAPLASRDVKALTRYVERVCV
jgi:hypothetical protein